MASEPITQALAAAPDTETTMPVLFIGHGSPMSAIEDTEFSGAWAEVARSLAKPRAVLCVSAHWETEGTQVTAMERPPTIYDFARVHVKALDQDRLIEPGPPGSAAPRPSSLVGLGSRAKLLGPESAVGREATDH